MRWPLLATGLGVLAAVLAVLLTPTAGRNAAAGLAGLLRLGLYLLGGALLALSAPALCRSTLDPTRAPPKAYLLIGLGVAASAIVTVVNVVRLERDIADPLGPALWIASMLLLLGYTLFPDARRIGWAARWPDSDAFLRERWATGLLIGVLGMAAFIRLIWLGDIPAGINPDEGDRAASAFDVLKGQGPSAWFDSGWYYINMVYFRLLAVSFQVFGDGVGGGRMLGALCGLGFVGAVAWLGIRNFGWRIGLLAATLAAGLGISLQYSRLLSEAAPTALLWALSIGAFLEGARTGRAWAWALAGLCGGLSLYFYPAARLWAVGAALSGLVLLLHQRDRRVVVGLGVAAVASVIAAAPFLVHLSMHRDETANRYLQTTVLDPQNQTRLEYLTPPEPLPELIALQVERTLGLFDRYSDGGGFFPSNRPLFPRPLAALTLVGAFYTLVRSWRDPRLAVISVWFWLGLSGVAVTVETPDYLRAVGMLPSLCFVIAVPLVDLLDRALASAVVELQPSRRRAILAAAPATVGLLLIIPEVTTYFSTFRTLPAPWAPMNREGQNVATLGVSGPVYSLEMNQHLVGSGWVRLIAPDVQRGRVPNPGRELPALSPVAATVAPESLRPEMVPAAGQTLGVVMAPDPNQLPYVDLLSRLYPGGVLGDGGDGRRTYQVDPAALAATRGVTLVSPDGSTRRVSTFGQIPSGTPLPANLTWRAGILFPRADTYRLVAAGESHVQVRLDGFVLGDSSSVDAQIVAAPGMHFLELSATVGGPAESVAVQVGSADATPRELAPDATYALMDAPWGLFARFARPSANQPLQANGFLDSTVAMAFFDPEMGVVSVPNSLIWSGSLVAPRSGTYRMAFAGEDTMHLEIDGQPVEVVTVDPDHWITIGTGSQVQLTEGTHRVRVILDITHDGREVARWNWVPPTSNGALDEQTAWSVVPPSVLRPDPAVTLVSPVGR